MTTKEYPCLLGPGFHDFSLKELSDFLKHSHPNSKTRQEMWNRYLAFLRVLQSTGISYQIWLAGSFTTEKPDPADIDTVVNASVMMVNALSPEQRVTLRELFLKENNPINKIRYLTDAYFFTSENERMERYWMEQYGFFRTKKAKGIARFTLTTDLTI